VAEIGKILVGIGIVLIIVGGVVLLLGRSGLPLGRLPGDFLYRGKNTTFYFPLATSILLSVVLSVLLYLISRFRRWFVDEWAHRWLVVPAETLSHHLFLPYGARTHSASNPRLTPWAVLFRRSAPV